MRVENHLPCSAMGRWSFLWCFTMLHRDFNHD